MTRQAIRLAVELMDIAHQRQIEENFIVFAVKQWIDGEFSQAMAEGHPAFTDLMMELLDSHEAHDIYDTLSLLEGSSN